MIQFLKESTFAVNEVFNRSWELLKKHYFSVAGLCFLLFVTSGLSNFLATTISDFNVVLSGFMAFFFMIMYFGLNLTLFKYILNLIDGNQDKKLIHCIPSSKELAHFFGAMLSIMVLSFALLMIVGAILFPCYTYSKMVLIALCLLKNLRPVLFMQQQYWLLFWLFASHFIHSLSLINMREPLNHYALALRWPKAMFSNYY